MSETLIGLLHKSSSHSRPSQIAWAVVWGCVCGLMPKTSLLFPVCLLFSFLLPIHFVTACICMLITSSCTPALHPLLGNLGHWLFQGERIRQLAQNLDRLPLAPWLKLHNTVVLGSLSFSVVMAWPVYWLIHQMLLRPYANWRLQQESQLSEEQSKEMSVELLSTSNLIGESADSRGERPPVVSPQVQPQPLAASLRELAAEPTIESTHINHSSTDSVIPSLAEAIDSIHALEDLLEKVSSNPGSQIDANAVLARATRASELVDEILQSLDSTEVTNVAVEVSEPPSSINDPTSKPLTVRIDAPQTFQSHDTKISIYRRARTGETLVSSSEQRTQSEKDLMPTANDSTAEQATLAVVEPPQSSTSIRATPANTIETVRRDVEIRQEEALRHLLSHLRALKEKV
jgi:uncharacterized protein (TIGR03546 family)